MHARCCSTAERPEHRRAGRRPDRGGQATTTSTSHPFAAGLRSTARAMRFVRGRVLDVGCGAGRVCLHLQERGLDVVGIDISPGAVEVCRRRGVRDVRVCPIEEVCDESSASFNTIVMLRPQPLPPRRPKSKARRLLRLFHALTSERGRIVGRDTFDPYASTGRSLPTSPITSGIAGGAARPVRSVSRIPLPADLVAEWFDYLMVSRRSRSSSSCARRNRLASRPHDRCRQCVHRSRREELAGRQPRTRRLAYFLPTTEREPAEDRVPFVRSPWLCLPATRSLPSLRPTPGRQTHAMRLRAHRLSSPARSPSRRSGDAGRWARQVDDGHREDGSQHDAGRPREDEGRRLARRVARIGRQPDALARRDQAERCAVRREERDRDRLQLGQQPRPRARRRREPAGLLRRPEHAGKQRPQHGHCTGDGCDVEPSGRQGGAGHHRVQLGERCRHDERRDARLGMGDDVRDASTLRHESRRRRRRGADADAVLRLLPRRRHGRHRGQSRHRLVLERERRGGPRHAGDRGHRASRPQAVRAGHGRRARALSIDQRFAITATSGRRCVRRLRRRLPDGHARQPLEARSQGARDQDQGQRRPGREHRGRARRPACGSCGTGAARST